MRISGNRAKPLQRKTRRRRRRKETLGSLLFHFWNPAGPSSDLFETLWIYFILEIARAGWTIEDPWSLGVLVHVST